MRDKAVLFDLDGTLVDTEGLNSDAFREAFRSWGVLVDPVTYKIHCSGRRTENGVEAILRRARIEPTKHMVDLLVEQKRAAFHKLLGDNDLPFYPGARERLTELHEAGFKLGIVTSAITVVPIAIRQLNLPLRAVVSGADVAPERGKPAADPYLAAAIRLGMKPQDCIAVEDTPVGIRSAHAAKMGCIAVMHNHTQAALHDADLVLADLTLVTTEAVEVVLSEQFGALTQLPLQSL